MGGDESFGLVVASVALAFIGLCGVLWWDRVEVALAEWKERRKAKEWRKRSGR